MTSPPIQRPEEITPERLAGLAADFRGSLLQPGVPVGSRGPWRANTSRGGPSNPRSVRLKTRVAAEDLQFSAERPHISQNVSHLRIVDVPFKVD